MMKRWFFILLLPVSMTACLGPTELYPADEADRPITIYVSTHGWHAGIVAESQHIRPFLPVIEQLPETRYLEFGWGDARYYTDPEAGLGLMLRAALLPTASVLHISGFDQNVEFSFPNSTLARLQISPAGMEAMAQYIAGYIKTGEENQAIHVSNGLYGDSLFVQANGIYMLPNTSNRWAARALRATGLAITPFYSLTKDNVIYQASRSGEIIQQGN